MPNTLYDDDLEATVDSSPGGRRGSGPAGATALLPRNLFPGDTPKIGSKLSFRVTHVYQDEIAVEPCGEKPAETSEPAEPEQPEPAEEPGTAEDQGLYL